MVYKPHDVQPGKKHPTVLFVYGGPQVIIQIVGCGIAVQGRALRSSVVRQDLGFAQH